MSFKTNALLKFSQKDPFIQQSPYYKKEWKELIQKPQLEPILIAPAVGFNLESGKESSLNPKQTNRHIYCHQ